MVSTPEQPTRLASTTVDRSENDNTCIYTLNVDSTDTLSDRNHDDHDSCFNSNMFDDVTIPTSPVNIDNSSFDSHQIDQWFTKKGLNIVHLNIHYVYPKLDEIKMVLNEQPNIDILCLCETFLHDDFLDKELHIDGYNIIRRDRPSHGGGILIYYKNSLACTIRHDLLHSDIEMVWLNIKCSMQKPFLLGYVYRPPSTTSDWLQKVETILEKVHCENKEVILLGDFNFNLLKCDARTRNWLLTMDAVNLQQLVTVATRCTDTTETLIDHAYTNTVVNISHVSVPHYSISDHYPVCISRKLSHLTDKGPSHKIIKYRSTKHFQDNHFLDDLSSQPWSVIDIYSDPNDALDFFLKLFKTVLDKHAPKRSKRVKRVNQPNWMNEEIQTARRTRDQFHAKKDTINYRIWCNKVKLLISNAKKSYYAETINNNKRNPKLLWKNLHDITGNSTGHQTTFINNESGEPILDPEETANTFNEFFTNVFRNYDTETANTSVNLTKLDSFVNEKLSHGNNFQIPLVSTDFVFEQLICLDAMKATGVDELNAKYLKLAAPIISVHVSKIINLSIEHGIYPDVFKKAKVTPIHKKGQKDDKNNYRPISILSVLSKVIERHVSNSLCNYLQDNNLIHDQQSGFRKQHSCQTALTKLVDDWLYAIDNGDIVGTVLLDLTKAFDLVNHDILLSKLSMYKFNSNSLSWFKSYLNNRSQQVAVGCQLSDSLPIQSGVPQGSVLGPLLFIIYINDLPLHTKYCSTDMFADDTTLTMTGKISSDLSTHINTDLDLVQQWCDSNKMVINPAKSKAMFITSKGKQHRAVPETSILIGESEIHTSTQEKLLGVITDSTLSWQFQIDSVIKKCNSLLFLLSRLKQYLSIHVRIMFYNAYILPHLDYCCTIWGNCNSEYLDRVTKFQKRAARLILDKDYDTPSEELFSMLNWMTFRDRIQYQKAILVYKILNNLAPSYLSNLFLHTCDTHSLNLRSVATDLLHIPKPNTELYRKSFAYSGSKIWNSLPENARTSTSLDDFKHSYLQWFHSH